MINKTVRKKVTKAAKTKLKPQIVSNEYLQASLNTALRRIELLEAKLDVLTVFSHKVATETKTFTERYWEITNDIDERIADIATAVFESEDPELPPSIV